MNFSSWIKQLLGLFCFEILRQLVFYLYFILVTVYLSHIHMIYMYL